MTGPEADKPKPIFESFNPPSVEASPRPGILAPRRAADPGLQITAAKGKNTGLESRPAVIQTATRPPRDAIAMSYKTGTAAPRVVAKGRGLVAEQIIARAQEYGVFVHESKELVALLMQVDLDDHIPPALYRAVAELLAWLYNIEAARPDGSKV